jgi:hypothetical protein
MSQSETEKIVDLTERRRYVLELKINKLRAIVQKSNNHYDADMAMIRIKLWNGFKVLYRGLILINVKTDWPVYDNK